MSNHPSPPLDERGGREALRPTWDSAGSVDAPAWPCTGWGLPGRRVATPPVRSYRTVSPLPAASRVGPPGGGPPLAAWAVSFLWHFPADFSGSGSRPPCPVVSGLSSRAGCLPGLPRLLGQRLHGRAPRASRRRAQDSVDPHVRHRASPTPRSSSPSQTGHAAARPARTSPHVSVRRSPSVAAGPGRHPARTRRLRPGFGPRGFSRGSCAGNGRLRSGVARRLTPSSDRRRRPARAPARRASGWAPSPGSRAGGGCGRSRGRSA